MNIDIRDRMIGMLQYYVATYGSEDAVVDMWCRNLGDMSDSELMKLYLDYFGWAINTSNTFNPIYNSIKDIYDEAVFSFSINQKLEYEDDKALG